MTYESKALKLNHVKRVVVDTTVQPKAVTFPTDVKLRYRALLALVKLAKQHDVPLRQTYVRVAKKALMMSGHYRDANNSSEHDALRNLSRCAWVVFYEIFVGN